MAGHSVLLGGGGFIGSCLVGRLAKRGDPVVVPARRPEQRKELRLLPGVHLLAADIHDLPTLVSLFAGATAVVNLVGILHDRDGATPYGRRFAQAHVDLPRRIVAAMQQTGVRRLLHVSALGAAPDAPSAYLRSKAAGEAVLREAVAGDPNLSITVLRPSVVFGPGDAFLNTFAALLQAVPVVPIAGGTTRFQPVHVGDVADVCLRALADDGRGPGLRVYELGGPRVYTLRQLLAYVGRLTGARSLVVDLPYPLARLQAGLLELLPKPPMSVDNLRSLQVDSVADATLAPPSWTPTPLEAVAPLYLGRRRRV